MAEYHVGCDSQGIYAGKLNRQKTEWRNKSNVTREAYDAVFQHIRGLLEDLNVPATTYRYTFRDGVTLEVETTIKKPEEKK